MTAAAQLGVLGDRVDLLTRYLIGQAAMRAGHEALDAGHPAEAAAEFDVAARVADVLALATEAVDPNQAARWDLVAVLRHRAATRARCLADAQRR
jgi:hypothetical protein